MSEASALDNLPGGDSQVGRTLGEPDVVDAGDATIAREIGESARSDAPAVVETGAQTQQGRVKADVQVADSRAKRALARESAADARISENVRRFLASEANGYLEVERIGPIEMPSIELGSALGIIRHAEIEATPVSQILAATFGGGTYRLVARRGDNSLSETDTVVVKVGGCDPKPKTATGKRWLAKVQRGDSLDEPPIQAPKPSEGGESMMQFIMGMLERDKERDRIRAEQDEARRRQDAEERKQEWKERQETEKAARAKELAELKDQRDREREDAKAQRATDAESEKARRERDLAEFNQRNSREAAAAKAELDTKLELMKTESAHRLKQIELDAEADRDRRRIHLDAEARRLESKDTHGLGLEGFGELRKTLAGALAKDMLKSAGIKDDEEEESGIGAAIADTIRAEGPELIQKVASAFLPKIAAWLPGGSPESPPPQVPHAQPRQIPPPAASASAPFVPDASTVPEPDAEVPQVEEPAPPPGVPSKEIAAAHAANYALGSVLQFVRPIGVLAMAQPEAAAAWDTPVGGGGETLDDLYRRLPKSARETIATDWPKFLGAVREASAADAEVIDAAVAIEGGAAWLEEFLAAGPWVPEESDAT